MIILGSSNITVSVPQQDNFFILRIQDSNELVQTIESINVIRWRSVPRDNKKNLALTGLNLNASCLQGEIREVITYISNNSIANVETYSAAISITIMSVKSIAVNLKEVTRNVIIYLSFVKG